MLAFETIACCVPSVPDPGSVPKKMVQLFNYKASAIPFEVSTPPYVCVFPEKGIVEPM